MSAIKLPALLCALLYVTATVAAAAQTDAAPDNEAWRALLGETFEQAQFLPVDEAFGLRIERSGDRLAARFSVADGYYLYRSKIRFVSDGDIRVAEIALPPGSRKVDQYFGEMQVLRESFTAPITLQRATPAAGTIRLDATYQGCAEGGICYAPVRKDFTLRLPAIIASARADDSTGGSGFTANTPSGFGLLLGAFLAGLLLTFTPCVLPMLPILSGVIARHHARSSDVHEQRMSGARGGLLALGYVLGSVAAYAAIGAVAGATGEQLQAYFQNAWAIGILVAVLVAMALSMFGVFTLATPAFLQNRIRARDANPSHSLPAALGWVFALGAGSAVIIGACVSPVLISFLGIAISQGDPWLGARMMAAMALGMGVPLIALGLGAGHLLPMLRGAGRWSAAVNHAFGWALLAVAVYLLGALPQVPVQLLWGALALGVSADLLRAWMRSSSAWRWPAGAISVAAFAVGAVLLTGALRPNADSAADPAAQADGAAHDSPFITVADAAQLDAHLARAASLQKPVLVEYYADWCVDCVRMEATTFRDPRIAATLARDFVALRIDVTDPRDAAGKAMKRRFGVFGPPAVLLFDRDGAELKGHHFYGFRDSDALHALLRTL